jgi:adenine-specific DNA glycosylase
MKRVFSIATSKESHKKPEIWNVMATIVPKGQAKEFNLSILDFASIICTAKNPNHKACAVNNICDFYQKQHAKKRGHQSKLKTD